jgi:subtilisin family serine protease
LPNLPNQQVFPELDNKILLIVAAAGNGGQISNPTTTPPTIGTRRIYPGAERGITTADDNGIDDNLLNVGASTRYDDLARFSTMAHVTNNNDRWLRTVAPGENIVSALPGGRYGVWSGTSMAAPIVSGIAALVLQVRPLDPPNTPNGRIMEDVVEEIEETGNEWECFVPSRSINMETARVDAYRAVINDQNQPTKNPPICQ